MDIDSKRNGTTKSASIISKKLGPTKNPISENEKTNYVQTLMHMLNGFIGSGILSMPMTFRDGGILLSSIVNPLIGVMICYCIHLLLAINQRAMVDYNSSPYDYHEVAEYAFLIGPKALRRFSKVSRYVVLSALVATQIGGCCVYFLFISTNLQKFLLNLLGPDLAPSKKLCLKLILPVVIATNWIRNIRYLSLFSTVSNLLQVVGIGIIFYNLFSVDLISPSRLPLVGERIPQFLVSTIFIFEGTSVSMSLFKTINSPRQFCSPLGVLNVGLFIITAFYFSLGFLGYTSFGEDVDASITLSDRIYDAVKLIYAIAVLFTYPIILYVPIQVVWPMIKNRYLLSQTNDTSTTIHKIKILIADLAFRSLLVTLTYALAEAIPKLELIISLIGSITSSSIAVIIPPILHLVAFWDHRKGFFPKLKLLAINLSILGIGIFGFVFGTYYSLMDIIKSYRNTTSVN